MKIILFLLGILISLFGILPLLEEININFDFLNFIPVGGVIYNIIIVILGLLVIYFSIKRKKK